MYFSHIRGPGHNSVCVLKATELSTCKALQRQIVVCNLLFPKDSFKNAQINIIHNIMEEMVSKTFFKKFINVKPLKKKKEPSWRTQEGPPRGLVKRDAPRTPVSECEFPGQAEPAAYPENGSKFPCLPSLHTLLEKNLPTTGQGIAGYSGQERKYWTLRGTNTSEDFIGNTEFKGKCIWYQNTWK